MDFESDKQLTDSRSDKPAAYDFNQVSLTQFRPKPKTDFEEFKDFNLMIYQGLKYPKILGYLVAPISLFSWFCAYVTEQPKIKTVFGVWGLLYVQALMIHYLTQVPRVYIDKDGQRQYENMCNSHNVSREQYQNNTFNSNRIQNSYYQRNENRMHNMNMGRRC